MAIETEKRSLLENTILHEEVLALLYGADDSISTAQQEQANIQLMREGFKNSRSQYKAAFRDLNVLRCHHQAKIQAELATEDMRLPSSNACMGELADFVGSLKNILGITKTMIISSTGSKLEPENKDLHVELLPEIEYRLARRCSWLSNILQCQGAESVVEKAATLVDSLEHTQEKHLINLENLAEDVNLYVELLSAFLAQQGKFVTECKFKNQKDIDMMENSLLEAACQTQAKKVDAIEQRLLSVTYTAQTQPALKMVQRHLVAAEAKAKAKLEELTAQVNQYESLGPEFKDLVTEYRKLEEELRHAEFNLKELHQAASAESP